MYYSPSCLYEYTLNFTCKNLESITHLNSQQKLEFKAKNIRLNHLISADLLERLCSKGKINDTILSLFTNDQTQLTNIRIKNVSFSKEALNSLLRQHLVTELCINNVLLKSAVSSEKIENSDVFNEKSCHSTMLVDCSINFNDLIDGLCSESFSNIRSLNVARNISLFGTTLFYIKHLKNLTR